MSSSKPAVALRFGYMVTDSKKQRDGIHELRQIDLFEITITPSPANPDTRVISMKSLKPVQLVTFEVA